MFKDILDSEVQIWSFKIQRSLFLQNFSIQKALRSVSKYRWQRMIPFEDQKWPVLMPTNSKDRIIYINKNIFSIGRGFKCDFQLDYPSLSHKHVTIYTRTEGQLNCFYLVRNGKNNVYINNIQVISAKQKPIKHDDIICFVKSPIISNTITFTFKVKWTEEDTTIFSRLQAQIKLCEELIQVIQTVMTCCRCKLRMITPVSIQRCNHKVCEACAIMMIQEMMEICPAQGCGQKINALRNDPAFMEISKSYFAVPGKEEVPRRNYFSKQAFMMQKWIKYNQQQQKKKLKKAQQEKDVQTIIKIPQAKVQSEVIKNIQPESRENAISQELTNLYQQIENLMNLKKDQINMNQNPSIDQNISPLQSVPPSHQQKNKSFKRRDQSAIKQKITPKKVDCWNCQKDFLFSSRDIELKQCKICLHPFCNIAFPPCKGGEDPLRPISQRIRIKNREHILSVLESTLRGIIEKKVLNYCQLSQLEFIFKFVMVEEQGKYAYFLQKQKQIITIELQTCVCDDCWSLLARQMILVFLKYNKSHLQSFSRLNFEGIMTKVTAFYNVKEQKRFSVIRQ